MFNEVRDGIVLIWNNKFEEAEVLFAKKKDVVPRYSLHHAEAAFLRSFITADTADTETAVTRLKATIELAENHIKLFENKSPPVYEGDVADDLGARKNRFMDCRIVLGDALYMTAVLQLTRGSKLKGVYNLRKSWKVFEASVKFSEANPGYDDEIVHSLKFGAGFFLFAVSIIPSKFLKFVELAGFKADRDVGLQYMRECHKTPGIRTAYATMLLLFNNLLLPRGLSSAQKYLDEAEKLIQESLTRFPTGSLFQVMGSHCARKKNNVDEGIKFMQLALSNCAQFPQPPLIYTYELANCNVMKLEFRAAAALYEALIPEAKFQVRALSGLQLASCYIMLGEHEKAKTLLDRIPTLVSKKSQFDPIVVKQAKRYSQNGGHFAVFELLYLRRDLVKMAPYLKDANALLDSIAVKTGAMGQMKMEEPKKKSSGFSFAKLASSVKEIATNVTSPKPGQVDYSFDNRASYLLIKGQIYKVWERHDEAIECFKEVINMKSNVIEKFYVPYCYYEMGESLFYRGKLPEAADMMKKANSCSGYDWEDPLKIRLRVAMDQLKHGGIEIDDDDGEPVATLDCSPAPSPALSPMPSRTFEEIPIASSSSAAPPSTATETSPSQEGQSNPPTPSH